MNKQQCARGPCRVLNTLYLPITFSPIPSSTVYVVAVCPHVAAAVFGAPGALFALLRRVLEAVGVDRHGLPSALRRHHPVAYFFFHRCAQYKAKSTNTVINGKRTAHHRFTPDCGKKICTYLLIFRALWMHTCASCLPLLHGKGCVRKYDSQCIEK